MAMRLGAKTLPIPNPHGAGDLDWTLATRILATAGIDPKWWKRL